MGGLALAQRHERLGLAFLDGENVKELGSETCKSWANNSGREGRRGSWNLAGCQRVGCVEQ